MSNRLATELSPYLLQHADNPVDWYPWGDDAFARAREQAKPIFLSIGYSTCHWCHVMEHESFESPDIAELLNRHFVSIKVDREERPDVDRVYMAFIQATTGSGGWPMSVWLTPDLKPFFGGTYFPPSSRWGRPGFVEVLQETARLWADERPKLLESAETLMARLAERQRAVSVHDSAEAVVAQAATLEEGVDQFRQAFDAVNGGFGGAPKFPRPAELLFLLREHVRAGHQDARTMVVDTLRAMANGGMRDHLGGGFHRYSVDERWRIPHFEKMLYDQAQLTLAFLEAGQATGDQWFVEVAADTIAYVTRDLVGEEGAFLSAEDADSLDPDATGDERGRKTEGAFYVWTSEQIEQVVGDDTEVVAQRYGVEAQGNAPQDPTGELRGKNQLYLARSVDDLAKATGRTIEEIETTLARARARLLDARSRRPRPHLDDKVLTAWNGLMLAACARAAYVLEGWPAAARDDGEAMTADAVLARAQRAARFLRDTMWDRDARVLQRRYRAGRSSIEGYSEDYAFLTWGLLELFQVDGDVSWLEWALELQARQNDLFWDSDGAGWFSTTGNDASVLLRMKEDYDGAEPSAGSVATLNLLTLARLTGDAEIRRLLEQALARFGPRLGKASRVVPLLTAVLSAYHAEGAQVVIVGDRTRPDTKALRQVLARHYLPFAVRVAVEPGEAQDRLATLLPYVATMTLRDGRATAYVCSNFACQEPVTDPDALDDQLAIPGGTKR